MLRSISVAGALAISAFTAHPLRATADARPAEALQAGQGRPHGPPPEAIEACINKAAGDACSVQLDERSIDGTCRALPQESDLVCLPNSPPR